MRIIAICARLAIAAAFPLAASQAWAEDDMAPSAADLAAEIQALKTEYEERIRALEERLADVQAPPPAALEPAAPPASQRTTKTTDNAFNPAIGVVLDGRVTSFSADASEIPGFRVGHHGERSAEGLSLGHTEVTLSSNVDDKFQGAFTLGLGSHPGEATELDVEEAWIGTLPGAGLPGGLRIKAGRALWTLGYLNELHAHADDFADRPLPYRVYLDNHWNDDGVEFSWVLPTDLYAEIGGGIFRGSDTPFGGRSADGFDARSAFARIGGDLGSNAAWRIGAYVLDGKSRDRAGGGHDHGHGEDDHAEHEDENGDHAGHEDEDEGENGDHAGHEDEDEDENGDHAGHEDEDEDENGDHAGHEDEDEDENGDHAGHEDEDENGEHAEHEHEAFTHEDFLTGGAFTGDGRLWGADIRFTWAPTGNPQKSELILQGEYFRMEEEGMYVLTEGNEEHREMLDGSSSGWYLQAVYRFMPRWRAGVRYSRLEPPDSADIDHSPWAVGVMADWTNSEFGRIRAQYNRETFIDGEHDDQFMLQYVMSLGAHAAHAF